MRLLRIVQIKKLLFVRAILALDEDNLTRRIFVERATHFFDNDDLPEEWSIVADLLRVADIFNLSNEVRNMVLRGHMFSKKVWKRMVWDRGWSLEDTYWSLEARLYKDLDLIVRVCSRPQYLTWWALSNKFPKLMHICENMAKIICHASLLKRDDVRLKNLTPVNRMCSLCDLHRLEDAFHIIMQCPGTQHLRTEMFNELESDASIKDVLNANVDDVMFICLGKCPVEYDSDVFIRLWCISGRHINCIYKYVLNQRTGVG